MRSNSPGVVNNPLVRNVFNNDSAALIAPGPAMFVITDDGDYVETDDNLLITT